MSVTGLIAVGLGLWTWRLATDRVTLDIPREVVGRPGRLIVISAETNAARVWWHACVPCGDGPRADLWPSSDGKTLIVCAAQPGRYPLVAWTARGHQATDGATCLVRVDDGPNPPPPPVPPTPPIPPSPVDPFARALKAAWEGDIASDRAPEPRRLRDGLASFYRSAAEMSDQPRWTTVGQLYAALQDAARQALPAEALPRVRDAIAGEFRVVMPTTAQQPLDAPTRATCRNQFERMARLIAALPA
jgi:hypothetical protein